MGAYKVNISQHSEVTSSKTYCVSGEDTNITMQRTIYNNLKSLVKNSDVKIGDDFNSDGYSGFLEDMCILHDNLILGSTHELPEGIVVIDSYLGKLGISEMYPFRKDMVKLSKFLNADCKTIDIRGKI